MLKNTDLKLWFGSASSILIGLSFGGLISGRVTFAVLAAAGIILLFLSGGSGGVFHRIVKFKGSPLVVAILVTLLFWSLSTLFSYSIMQSVQVLAREILFLFLSLVFFIYLKDKEKQISLLTRAALCGLALFCTLALIAMTIYPDIYFWMKGELLRDPVTLQKRGFYEVKMSIKDFALAASILSPFVIWSGIYLGARWRFVAGWIVISLILIVYLSMSKAGFLGITLSGLILLIYLCYRGAFGLKIAMLGVTSLVVIVALGVGFSEYFIASSGAGGLQSHTYFPTWLIEPARQGIWRYVAILAMERPWFGWGLNVIDVVSYAYFSSSGWAYTFDPRFSHPHSWALEIFAETGLGGFLSFIVTISISFFYFIKEFLRTKDIGPLSIIAASGGFWSSGLFGFSFWSAWWQVSYLMIVMIIASTVSWGSRKNNGERE